MYQFSFRKVPFGRKTEKKQTNLASIFNRKFQEVVSSLSIEMTHSCKVQKSVPIANSNGLG